MLKKVSIIAIVLAFVLITMTGCMPGDGTYTIAHPAGFFWGIWHGWIAPISLIVGAFDHSIRIYEPLNTGWWYDLGLYIAIISGFGGLSLSRKRKNKDS